MSMTPQGPMQTNEKQGNIKFFYKIIHFLTKNCKKHLTNGKNSVIIEKRNERRRVAESKVTDCSESKTNNGS